MTEVNLPAHHQTMRVPARGIYVHLDDDDLRALVAPIGDDAWPRLAVG
jgi:hypothetical protein